MTLTFDFLVAQHHWVRIDQVYVRLAQDIQSAHKVELRAWKDQVRKERKAHRAELQRMKTRHTNKTRQLKCAGLVKAAKRRFDIYARVRSLEKAVEAARVRADQAQLDLERYKYGWTLAEFRIERLHHTLERYSGRDGLGSAMEIDDIPASQLPYDYPSPVYPFITLPKGSFSRADSDSDVLMGTELD